jgi:translocation and assembly module TamA
VLATVSCAAPRSVLGGANEPVVREIRIEGAERVPADRIRSRLATEETGPLPWSEVKPFDPVVWANDLRRIERIYEAEGYYGARVVDSGVVEREDGVTLWARVEEPPETRVRALEVVGLSGLPDDVGVGAREAIRLQVGEIFRESDWEWTKRDVERSLRERGYAEAQAGGDARVDLLNRVVDVTLDVAPGHRYRFGNLYLAAAPPFTLPADRVLAFARDALPEDAWFSQSGLARAQERIFELGLFGAVSVTAAAPDPGSDRIPLVVEVRQSPTSALRLGGGIGIEPGRQEGRAVAEWTDRNFLGGLRSLGIGARAGWAFVPDLGSVVLDDADRSVVRDGPFAELHADLAQPRFLGIAALQAFWTIELEQDVLEAYRFRSARAETGVGWRVTESIDLRLSAAFDLYRIYDTPLGGSARDPASTGCSGTCRLTYLEQSVTFGRRFEYRQRQEGTVTTLRLREGGAELSADWLQLMVDSRTYAPLSPRLQLAGRIRAATILARGGAGVPIPLRLYSGGSMMRGFGARQLSPQVLVPTSTPGVGAGVPVGGQGLLDGSVELRWSAGQRLGLAAFVDAGAVSAEALDPSRLARLLFVAPGVGLRYRSPVGPVRLDLAYRLQVREPLPFLARPGETLARERSGCLGGGSEALCGIHISLGEAF